MLADEFNCTSRWSDDTTGCSELRYLVAEAVVSGYRQALQAKDGGAAA